MIISSVMARDIAYHMDSAPGKQGGLEMQTTATMKLRPYTNFQILNPTEIGLIKNTTVMEKGGVDYSLIKIVRTI